MRGRKAREEEQPEATLDITSTIDVVFLLLIFFVATIQLPAPEANIRAFLPRTEESPAAAGMDAEPEETEDETVIRITMRGVRDLRLNGAPVAGGFRELDSQLGALRRVSVEGVETKVIIDAGPDVPYYFVVNALDLCGKYEFTNVSFFMPQEE